MTAMASLATFIADDLIDFAPIRNSTDVAVVDIEVGFHFRRGFPAIGKKGTGGIIAVDSIELEPPLFAPGYSFFQRFAIADGPQNELVPVG